MNSVGSERKKETQHTLWKTCIVWFLCKRSGNYFSVWFWNSDIMGLYTTFALEKAWRDIQKVEKLQSVKSFAPSCVRLLLIQACKLRSYLSFDGDKPSQNVSDYTIVVLMILSQKWGQQIWWSRHYSQDRIQSKICYAVKKFFFFSSEMFFKRML